MVYDTVDDVDKFSKKKVVLGRIRLKIEAKVFFFVNHKVTMQFMNKAFLKYRIVSQIFFC